MSTTDGTKVKSKKESSKKDKAAKKSKRATLPETSPEATGVPSPAVAEAMVTETSPILAGDDASAVTPILVAAGKASKKRKTPVEEVELDELSLEPTSKKRKSSVEEIEVDITAPEPPSKKELRRLKKGKPLGPSKSGAESTPEPDDKKTAVEKRSEHGVWIGNLPWSATKDGLRKFLVEFSDLTEDMITRVHMPSPDDAKPANKVETNRFAQKQLNKGFAYVDFTVAKGVELAIELSETLMTGRRVLIKNSNSFVGRPEKTKEEVRNDGKPASKRVFLGNLSFDVTEDILTHHFEKCGAVESVKVATFEDTGKCKGYAWIVFEELEAAQHAVRGFVRIEEEDSNASESESEDEPESGSGSDEDAVSKPKAKKPKKTKTRKWWVNRISGRPLRMEFAEDAQVRYKKRYGKEGTKRDAETPGDASGGTEERKAPRAAAKVVPKPVQYRQEYAPRLTGGIVESKGKKTTF